MQLVNVRFAVVGGSSTETAQQKGAAHYLATAAFTGNNESSGLRVVGLLEGLGASFSATADREKVKFELLMLFFLMKKRDRSFTTFRFYLIVLPPLFLAF